MADTATETTKPKFPPGVYDNGNIDWPLTFKLRRPISALGDDYSAIELKAPTAKIVVDHELGSKGVSEANAAAIISDLSAIPEASVLKMDGSDFMKLMLILARFFQQAGE